MLLTEHLRNDDGTGMVEGTLDLVSDRIECFLPFDTPLVETIYDFYQDHPETRQFEFFHKRFASFGKEAQAHILLALVVENQQEMLKEMD